MKDLALKIAYKSFEGKTDLAGKPYYEHLKRVSANVPDYGQGELKIIALLHDILEDCPFWNEKSLRIFFSDKIVDTIIILTKLKSESYEQYIERILKDGWACEVKKADLEDNMNLTRLSEITEKDIERIKKYHKAYNKIIEKTL